SIMSARIIHPISDFLAESHFSYTEIDRNRNEIGSALSLKLQSVFKKLGFTITDFCIEGTSFDDETLKRINRISDVTAEAQAAKIIGMNYSHLQQLEAIRDAARNENGAAGIGLGVGAGMGLGQSMAQAFHNTQMQSPSLADDSMAKLETLKKMVEAELITKAEYSSKKQQILETF
ncbi:MAG: SPFH domain-containing protein, partial [Methylococcales bacterium]|nr:SPFH domain-containing protein [Methylococcales bacterium]